MSEFSLSTNTELNNHSYNVSTSSLKEILVQITIITAITTMITQSMAIHIAFKFFFKNSR